MEWIVRIQENVTNLDPNDRPVKNNQRIVVKFDAMNEEISIIGQYKPKHQEWFKFGEESIRMDSVNLDVIREKIFDVYKKMNERIKAYRDLEDTFNVLKEIEINDNE